MNLIISRALLYIPEPFLNILQECLFVGHYVLEAFESFYNVPEPSIL